MINTELSMILFHVNTYYSFKITLHQWTAFLFVLRLPFLVAWYNWYLHLSHLYFIPSCIGCSCLLKWTLCVALYSQCLDWNFLSMCSEHSLSFSFIITLATKKSIFFIAVDIWCDTKISWYLWRWHLNQHILSNVHRCWLNMPLVAGFN